MEDPSILAEKLKENPLEYYSTSNSKLIIFPVNQGKNDLFEVEARNFLEKLNIEHILFRYLISDAILYENDQEELVIGPNPETRDPVETINQIKAENDKIGNLLENELKEEYIVDNFPKVHYENLSWFYDVFEIDIDYTHFSIFSDMNLPKFLAEKSATSYYLINYTIYCNILYDQENKDYLGHVWSFISDDFPDYIGIFGIRSSIMSIISNNKKWKGVSNQIIKGVAAFGKTKGRKELIIPWPLPPMIGILKKFGFVKHMERTYDSPQYKFYSRLTIGRDWYSKNLNEI